MMISRTKTGIRGKEKTRRCVRVVSMSLSVAVVWSIMGNGLFLYRLSLATGQHDQVDQDDRAVAHGHDFDDVGRVATGVSHSVVPWQTSEERRASESVGSCERSAVEVNTHQRSASRLCGPSSQHPGGGTNECKARVRECVRASEYVGTRVHGGQFPFPRRVGVPTESLPSQLPFLIKW